MLYVIHCLDKDDSASLRDTNAAAHAAYMKQYQKYIIWGGPLLSENRSQRLGILLIVQFLSEAKVRDFIKHEPYSKAGLFQKIEIHPHQVMLNNSLTIENT